MDEIRDMVLECLRMVLQLKKLLDVDSINLAGPATKARRGFKGGLQSFRVVWTEEKVLQILDEIERQKSLLALAIEQVDS
jgi:hypothetical protein